MSSYPEKKSKLKDKDENYRLRHGLNVQCLTHIFQYLYSADLYIVDGMNQLYQQIINDLVIQEHKVNFDSIRERGPLLEKISQILQTCNKM